MQTLNRLSSQEIAAVARSLTNWTLSRGTKILGAQLGILVSQAIHPRTVRELGGLKVLCESDLSGHVRPKAAEAFQADIQYEILSRHTKAQLEAAVLTQKEEVAGAELWRFFANPGLACKLGVRLPSATLVAPPDFVFEPDVRILPRMTSQDYKDLALQFCERQPSDVRTFVAPTLNLENFYPHWITALRKARTANVNPLRDWETVRAEHIAKRLYDTLEQAGVDAATAADIVNLSRPLAKPEHPVPTAQSSRIVSAPGQAHGTLGVFAATRSHRAVPREDQCTDDTEVMRKLVHKAVDLMSLADLRDLRISAGVLHDALRSLV